MSRLAPDSEKMKRYPLRRWGWAFIEDELAKSAVERAFGSQPKGDDKPADEEKENENDDDLLAMYLDPLTPLQTKVVEVLWTRRYRTKFKTLKDTAWNDRRPVSDLGVIRLLKRINARWTRLPFSLEISESKDSVKLIRPDPKADGKV